MDMFNKIFLVLAFKSGTLNQLMIDATHLKVHRTAADSLRKARSLGVSGALKAV